MLAIPEGTESLAVEQLGTYMAQKATKLPANSSSFQYTRKESF
jgi:hypothetical protein